jgi:hypothetical protein
MEDTPDTRKVELARAKQEAGQGRDIHLPNETKRRAKSEAAEQALVDGANKQILEQALLGRLKRRK